MRRPRPFLVKRTFLTKFTILLVVVTVVLVSRTWLPVPLARDLIRHAAYWFLLVAVVWLGFTGYRQSRFCNFLPCLQRHLVGLSLVLTIGTYFQLHEKREYRVLYDEFGLSGVGFMMHRTREAVFPERAHYINGRLSILNSLVDKRPAFFPFLLSCVHDITGYRVDNVFYMNAGLGYLFLLMLYSYATRVAGKAVGWFVLALASGIPLVAQVSTSGGYDLLNLCLILGVLIAAQNYLNRAGIRGMDLLALSAVLLAQVRYESVVFLVCVALVIGFKWWRTRVIRLTWAAVLAPIFIIMPLLTNRVFLASPQYMETKPGQAFFSLSYFQHNAEHAIYYLFNPDLRGTNSTLFSFIGIVAIAAFAVLFSGKILRQGFCRSLPDATAITWVSVICANTFMMLCVFWGEWDDPIVSRFSLPLKIAMLVALVHVLAGRKAFVRHARWMIPLLLVRSVAFGTPAAATREVTANIVTNREVNWLREQLQKYEPTRTFVFAAGSSGVIAWGFPSRAISAMNMTQWQVKRVIDENYYDNVLVFQRFYIQPSTFDLAPDEKSIVPADYVLETVAEVRPRFDVITRISRVVDVNGSAAIPPPEFVALNAPLPNTYSLFLRQLEMLP